MKKYFLCALLSILFFKISTAQVDFGIKGGLNFFKITDQVNDGVESVQGDNFGFNAGIWLRVKIPLLGWGVRPELNYVHLKSDIKGIKEAYIIQKIDIPVLLNKSFFGVLNLFAGPSFQYLIKDDTLEGMESKEVSSSDFTMGLQYGIGLEFKNFGIDLRMDHSFGKDVSTFVESTNNKTHTLDNRPSLFIVGLYYNFF